MIIHSKLVCTNITLNNVTVLPPVHVQILLFPTLANNITIQECTLTVEEARYKQGCVNWNQVTTSSYRIQMLIQSLHCSIIPSAPLGLPTLSMEQYHLITLAWHGWQYFWQVLYHYMTKLLWLHVMQVISLEGWTDVMYFVQDAHSFWNWIYFVCLIVVCIVQILHQVCSNMLQVGSFFMINLCLVVIATQFSETKKRETAKMKAERAKFTSSSTLSSFTNRQSRIAIYDTYTRILTN